MTRKKTKEEFFNEAKIKHNNKYDYTKVNYINSKDKVIIICKEHGEFSQVPSHHIKGHGCKRCSELFIGNNNRSSKEDFIKKALKIHGDKYDYNKATNCCYF